jgi:ketosteroid isomerase-like protein
VAQGRNETTVREAYELAKRGDHRTLRTRIADDATWKPAREGAWNPCRDADQIVRTLVWRTTANRLRPGEAIDIGDRVVMRLRGRRLDRLGARGFWAPKLYQVVVVRDGRIASMQDYRSREEAFAAVGLTG